LHFARKFVAHGLIFEGHTSDQHEHKHQLSPQKTERSYRSAKLQKCDKDF
jgi:hypothetical protein